MKAFDRRAADFTEYLQKEAGKDARQDAFNSGYIAAVKDLLLITLDGTKETE